MKISKNFHRIQYIILLTIGSCVFNNCIHRLPILTAVGMCVRSTTGTDEDGMTEVLLELLPESADCNLPVLGDVGCSEFVGKSLTVVMVGAKAHMSAFGIDLSLWDCCDLGGAADCAAVVVLVLMVVSMVDAIGLCRWYQW